MSGIPKLKSSNMFSNFLSLGSTYSHGFCRIQNKDSPLITAIKTSRDIDEDTSRIFSEIYIAQPHSSPILPLQALPSASIPILKPVTIDVSASGTVFSVTHNKEGNPVVEINKKEYNLKIDASAHHGKVLGDTWFGGISWSNDDRFVAYVARTKETKLETFFECTSDSKSIESAADGHVSSCSPNMQTQYSRTKFDFKEDWGERFDGVSSTVIAILDTTTGYVKTVSRNVDSRGEGATIGCPVFAPDSYKLVYTCWPAQPRRLGVTFCHHRPCSIYEVDLSEVLLSSEASQPQSMHPDDKLTTPSKEKTTFILNNKSVLLSESLAIARLARFSPDGQFLVILGRTVASPYHNSCYELHKLARKSSIETTNKLVEIVPIVHTPSSNVDFPGLFVDNIPSRCFIDNRHILLTSLWRSTESIISINIETNELTRLNPILVPPLYEEIKETAINVGRTGKSLHNNGWNDPSQGCASVLEAAQGHILYTSSTPLSPQRLALAQLATETSATKTTIRVASLWNGPISKFVTVSSKLQCQNANNELSMRENVAYARSLLANMRWRTIELNAPVLNIQDLVNSGTNSSSNVTVSTYEAIIILPPSQISDNNSSSNSTSLQLESQSQLQSKSQSEQLPLIVVPHGGPHSCTITQYFPAYAYLAAQLNAVVMHVNYRGSIGFGEASIKSLPGHIGDNDVADVIHSVESLGTVLSQFAPDVQLDPQCRSIIGGSHGGFLGAHLIGQYPSMFRSAVLRNPVTNIPSMLSFCDIPDWCYVETQGGDSYDFSTCVIPSIETLSIMHNRSPIAYIDSVKTPTLLCLGGNDRRVPPGQGIEYFHMLRARNVPVRLLWFPEDNHSIDKPVSEFEQWVVAAEWIKTHFN